MAGRLLRIDHVQLAMPRGAEKVAEEFYAGVPARGLMSLVETRA